MERFEREYNSIGVELQETVEQTVEDCDAVVLVTEWNQYRELDWESLGSSMRGRVVLDGRLVLDRIS